MGCPMFPSRDNPMQHVTCLFVAIFLTQALTAEQVDYLSSWEQGT